jgi:hypothetical protein
MLLREGADLTIQDVKARALMIFYFILRVCERIAARLFPQTLFQGCTAPQLARIHGLSTISSLVRSDSGEQQEQQVVLLRWEKKSSLGDE